MGYLTAQNQQQVIAHIVKVTKDLKLIRQSDNIGVNVNGENELAVRALTHFDVNGKFDVHDLAGIVQQIRTELPKFRDDYPYPDEKNLEWLDSLEAIAEASKEMIRRFMQPAAIDNGLYKKFNTRVAFLQAEQIHRPKEQPKEEPKNLTPQEKVKAELDARYVHVKSTINSIGPSWNTRATRAREKLNGLYDDMVRKGDNIAKIEKTIAAEIRNLDSPIR